jgi:hypothetical protein
MPTTPAIDSKWHDKYYNLEIICVSKFSEEEAIADVSYSDNIIDIQGGK